jgi:hypothetical protein
MGVFDLFSIEHYLRGLLADVLDRHETFRSAMSIELHGSPLLISGLPVPAY